MTALSTSANERKLVDLSVLMPFFNHGANLAENVKTTLADLNSLLQLSYELIVVDDGSTDATYQEACRIASANPHVSVVRLDSNSGKGAALRTGFAASRGGLICFLDGDLQISARHIPRFIEYMRLERADVVVASKRHPLSSVDYPRTRRILSRSYQILTSIAFGLPLTDTQAGLKLFRRRVLEQVFPKALVKRYAFDAELLSNAHRLGYRIVEAPIEISGEGIYKSHVDLAAVWRMFYDTLGIFYRMHIRGYYDGTSEEVPPSRKVAVVGPGPESLVTVRHLTSKGFETGAVRFARAGSVESVYREFDGEDPAFAFVCVGNLDEVCVDPQPQCLDPYLDVLARMLGRSAGYKCFAFTAPLYPGTTEDVIVPYLESHSQKMIEKDFDVVVLPSFEDIEHILPQSRQPQPLVVGSTGLKGIEALSGVLREFEPVMLRTEPTIAEAALLVRRLVRSNEHSLAGKILDVCTAADVDVERVIRTANIWWDGAALSGNPEDRTPPPPASKRQRG